MANVLENIPQDCFHRNRELWEKLHHLDSQLVKIIDILPCGSDAVRGDLSQFSPNDTVAMLAVILEHNQYAHRENILGALDTGGLAGDAAMSYVVFMSSMTAPQALPELEEIGAFLAYDETGMFELSGRSACLPRSTFLYAEREARTPRDMSSYDVLIPLPALAGASGSAIKSLWAAKMLTAYFDLGRSHWLDEFGQHSQVPFGDASEELLSAMSCNTGILDSSPYFFEDEFSEQEKLVFELLYPIGDVQSGRFPGLGEECRHIEGICAIWSAMLRKYKINWDFTYTGNDRASLSEFCEGILELGGLLGADEMIHSLAQGVPVDDIVA